MDFNIDKTDLRKHAHDTETSFVVPDLGSADYKEKAKDAKAWSMSTGIPLVYVEDDDIKAAAERFHRYNTLSTEIKAYSDKASNELFKLDNNEHFYFITNFDKFIERDDSGIRVPLTEGFFDSEAYINFDANPFIKEVNKTMNERFVYLVFTFSSGKFSQLIRAVTNDPFSHVSVSFDDGFRTMTSFLVESKKNVNKSHYIDVEGLVRENPLMTFDTNTKYEMYKIKVTTAQKRAMLDFVLDVLKKGSNYNKMLLFKSMFLGRNYVRKDNQPYSLVCSQYVTMFLNAGGVKLFDKAPEFVRPYDLLKLSSKKKLKFHKEGFIFDDYIDSNREALPPGFQYQRPEQPMRTNFADWVNKQTLTLIPV